MNAPLPNNSDDPRIVSDSETGKLDHDHVEEIFTSFREHSSDSTDNAVFRGKLLGMLRDSGNDWDDIEKGTGYKRKALYKFIQLDTDEKMKENDWEKPAHWTDCYMCLGVSRPIFDAMKASPGFLNRFTTARQIQDFVKLYTKQKQKASSKPATAVSYVHPATNCDNQIVCCDYRDGLAQLPDESIGIVITSPPYAEQRKEFDDWVPEGQYRDWFCSLMDALWLKMTPDGNVLIVIRTHIIDGQASDYVMRARLAVRDRGWVECSELFWYKPDGGPLGSKERPRQLMEQILWFSKSTKPYIDLKACGNPSKRVGMTGSNIHGLIRGVSPGVEGVAATPNVVRACVGEIDEESSFHYAPYPPTLVRPLILTFAKPGSIILDPFAGSGTTCLVAQSLDYDFIGFDKNEDFVKKAIRRLQTEPKYFRGAQI